MLSRYVVSQVKHNSYFLVGLVLGLWLALAAVPLDDDIEACVGTGSSAPLVDEYEPHHEEKPLGSSVQAAGRSVQRPRYYSTELGMRDSLLAGVLSSEAALNTRVAALNKTAARLQPSLRFFITASALQAAPGLANVVGFTDTREMLKPFHALKYLADNYLEEYNFFFLVSDTSFVNSRRLTELVSQLSVSQDVYMGTVSEDDSHYCSLEGGILLSNSVLRAVHNELDWCVRNSYSPHHHENIGRCVLHAAHLSCMSSLQGETYVSLQVDSEDEGASLSPALATAVTAYPVAHPRHFHQIHAYVSRVLLERGEHAARTVRAALWRSWRRHAPGFRNATWPPGLRADPGLAPPPPHTRFDHLRWTSFNATHALMSDDHRAVAELSGAHRQAVHLVLESARAWAASRWPHSADVRVVWGAWLWEPAYGLRYKLLLRLVTADPQPATSVRAVEVSRPLGAARLVGVPYVTESARLALLLPLSAARPYAAVAAALGFLHRYATVGLQKDKNTGLIVVIVRAPGEDSSAMEAVRENVAALAGKHRGAQLEVLETELATAPPPDDEPAREDAVALAAVAAASQKLSRDALVLMCVPELEFNEDFLNRVRMNTVAGTSWFLASVFARYAQYAHPRAAGPDGARPTTHTGRFNLRRRSVLAFYRKDYDSALAERGAGARSVADVLAASALHCLHAPEPGAVLPPPAPPCRADDSSGALPDAPPGALSPACLRAHRDAGFQYLDLGARHTLAKLLLETQAELE